jgi:hypothetical protein
VFKVQIKGREKKLTERKREREGERDTCIMSVGEQAKRKGEMDEN